MGLMSSRCSSSMDGLGNIKEREHMACRKSELSGFLSLHQGGVPFLQTLAGPNLQMVRRSILLSIYCSTSGSLFLMCMLPEGPVQHTDFLELIGPGRGTFPTEIAEIRSVWTRSRSSARARGSELEPKR